MHFIPLIYFGGLTYYFWQKHRTFDVATYMSLLYTITSLCCVLMVMGGFLNAQGGGVLYDGWEPEFGIIPTILYCGLITLTVWPFSFIRPERLETIGNVHRYTIYAFTALVVLQGIVMFYLVGDSITDLLNGDFRYLKEAHYSGDISPADAKMLTMPLPVQLMYLLSFMTLLALPLFFYYTCVEQRSLWLTVPLLAFSVSPVLRGMLMADRTEIIHYGLMFFFCLTFFQNFITKRVRNFFLVGSLPVIGVALTYFFAVSASRFENEDEGASGSILEYAGQPYANFCYFYENHNRELYYVEREFPVISYFVFKSQYTDTKQERSAKEGFHIGVFATHIGSWMLDTGVIGCIFISVLFAILCCLVIYRYDRKEFDVAEVLMLFALGTVPTFGIFYYRYYTIATAVVYVTAIALYAFSRFIFVWNKEETDSE